MHLVNPLAALGTVSFPALPQTNLRVDLSDGERTKYPLSPLPKVTHPHLFWAHFFLFWSCVFS